MKYKKFEELPCWKKARELCHIVFDMINDGKLRKDFSLRNQVWAAAGSVMDNIAEGFDDGSTREFIRFWVILKDHAVKCSRSFTGA